MDFSVTILIGVAIGILLAIYRFKLLGGGKNDGE